MPENSRLPKIGEIVTQDGIPYKVTSDFLGVYFGKAKFARQETELDLTKLVFQPEEPPKFKLTNQERGQILKDLVEPEGIKQNFQREIILLAKLVNKFPHRGFWLEGFKPALKVNSLTYWINKPEVEELYKRWSVDLMSKTEAGVILEKERVVENIVLTQSKKPRNLLDILD